MKILFQKTFIFIIFIPSLIEVLSKDLPAEYSLQTLLGLPFVCIMQLDTTHQPINPSTHQPINPSTMKIMNIDYQTERPLIIGNNSYVPPRIEIIEVSVEKGFADSSDDFIPETW